MASLRTIKIDIETEMGNKLYWFLKTLMEDNSVVLWEPPVNEDL